MNNILIINHSVKNCGVYQYGKRFANILKKSNKYNFIYLEIKDKESFLKNVNYYNPKIIIYNHLNITIPWATEDLITSVRTTGIKQGTIVHNTNYSQFFDFYLHQDPNFETFENNFNILRPLFDYDNNHVNTTKTTKIGSFGFGFKSKFYPDICRLVNSQAKDFEDIELNLHLTKSFFCDNSIDINFIIEECKQNITENNIRLNITSEFISDNEMLDFLGKNDINVFLYNKYVGYNGISSVIDYALSVKKPIGICQSNMFSHIWNAKPSILLEDSSIKSIIDNGIKPLEIFHENWKQENFINHIEDIIAKILEK
jgi:hypothetical protein